MVLENEVILYGRYGTFQRRVVVMDDQLILFDIIITH